MKTVEQKTKRVPAIRFAGFDDEWVEKKLGEMASFSKGMGYSKGDLKENGTPIVLYGRLYTKYETIISDVDTFADAKSNSVYSKGGEVIVPGSGETAEDISIASVVKKSGVLLGGDLNVITPPKNLDSVFLAISISNGKPHSDMAKMAQGKSVVHLHNTDLAEINLPYPNIIEQQKIGSFFSNIDSLISLEQKKYDKLTQVKKSMLEKMFPKEGATVPEIRFTGFSRNWVWKELDDIIVRIATGLNPRDNFKLNSGGSNYYVTIKNFEHGHLYLDEKCDRIDDCALQLIQVRSDLQKDDLLFSSIGRIGDCYLIKNNPQNWNINESVFTLRPNKAIAASNYLFHVVHCDIVLSQILDSVTGSTFKSIKIGDLKKALIPIPCKEEQIQIANYLDNLDSLISLQQRKLEKLKNIKKSLLEKMFV